MFTTPFYIINTDNTIIYSYFELLIQQLANIPKFKEFPGRH